MNESGYFLLEKFFPEHALERVETRIVQRYREAANRCGIDAGGPENRGVLCALLEAMETDHKAEAYAVQKFLAASVWELFDDRFFAIFDPLLPEGKRIQGVSFFINRPRTQRLLAKWHSERHYYPDLKNFWNCHFPLFGDKTPDNGAMSVIPGSHLMEWTYDGYSPGSDAIYQKEIGEDQLNGYQSVVLEEKRGDLCVFHANLVHRSNENTTDKYSFAMVCRVYVP